MAAERVCVLAARLGICSRSEATHYIKLGLITVDGKVVRQPAALAPMTASVELLDRGRRIQENKVTIMLHKPAYYASCRATEGQPLARKLLVPANRAASCRTRHDPSRMGRLGVADVLDEASSGVLLFSQDGRVATRVARDLGVEKEYSLRVKGRVTTSQLIVLREVLAQRYGPDGEVPLDGVAPVVEQDGSDTLRVVLRGPLPSLRVREASSLAGLLLDGVSRTRIGRVGLDDVAEGMWTVIPTNNVLEHAYAKRRHT